MMKDFVMCAFYLIFLRLLSEGRVVSHGGDDKCVHSFSGKSSRGKSAWLRT
jgi:hypothetical protein